MKFKRLKEVRISCGKKQNEVSQFLNINQSCLSRWENGTITIPLEQILKLARYYNVNLDYLFGLTANQEKNNIQSVDKKIIGQNLKQIRKKYNCTQKEWAVYLKTTQSTISAIENGNILILTDYLFKLAKKYHYSIDFIFNNLNYSAIKRT